MIYVGSAPHRVAVCHECKMLYITFCRLSFHGYCRLIRHKVMHMPSGLWQHDEVDDISPKIVTTRRHSNNNYNKTCKTVVHLIKSKTCNNQIFCLICLFVILTVFPSFWPPSQLFENPDIHFYVFNLPCLWSIFKILHLFFTFTGCICYSFCSTCMKWTAKGSPEIHNAPGGKWMALMI